jgi:hypothetical protein
VVLVVVAVSVDVCAVELLKVSEVEERLHVVGLTAFESVVVTAQVSVTVPVNELPGVTVMVEVPVEACVTVMLPLLLREKLLLPAFGFCQKSPQPAKNGVAASNTSAHFPILIAAPLKLSSGCVVSRNLHSGYRLDAHPVLPHLYFSALGSSS